MKIFPAALTALSFSIANAVDHRSDIYYHEKKPIGPSMWHFSPDGLTIFSPDGKIIKKHRKQSVCKPYMSRGQLSENCYFFDMQSDGHRYVWAASLAAHKLDIFDIDTGDYVGYRPTCSTPLDLQYHPGRQEMWIRCAQQTGEDGSLGEIDVISTNSISTDHDLIFLNDTGRPYGRIVIDSSLGGIGYITQYDGSYITELDLSSKEVIERYDIPKAYGAYDSTYSPVNEHIYARSRVCCSCGPGQDIPDCGSRPSLKVVKLGPNASPNPQNGTCSSPCEGSPADTIGVIEFDTVGKTIVAEHNIKSGTGFGADPIGAPDGQTILLLPNDGGQYVRVLKPSSNGASSVVVTDIPVAFKGGLPGTTVVSDAAFVQDENRNIMVIAANSDNDVVLVDMDDNYRFVKMKLTDAQESSATGGSRQVEWAVGTDYVWVNGGQDKEQYVIMIEDGIDSAKVVRTLSDVTDGKMIFVNNYERLRAAEEGMKMEEKLMKQFGQSEETSKLQEQTKNMDTPTKESDDSAKTISIAALIIAIVALIMGLVMFFSSKSANPDKITHHQPAQRQPEAEQAPDEKYVA